MLKLLIKHTVLKLMEFSDVAAVGGAGRVPEVEKTGYDRVDVPSGR